MAVSNLLIGVLGALVASNQPAALSNLVTQTTGVSIVAIDTNSPVEKEFQKIEDDDDKASDDVDVWIRENEKFSAQGAGVPASELKPPHSRSPRALHARPTKISFNATPTTPAPGSLTPAF